MVVVFLLVGSIGMGVIAPRTTCFLNSEKASKTSLETLAPYRRGFQTF
jgi:hypothetical protein